MLSTVLLRFLEKFPRKVSSKNRERYSTPSGRQVRILFHDVLVSGRHPSSPLAKTAFVLQRGKLAKELISASGSSPDTTWFRRHSFVAVPP